MIRDLLPCRFALLAVLVSSVALARDPYEKGVIRTQKVSDHPSYPTSTVYVSGQVATVLRFEKDVNPAKPQLLGWEGRFKPLLVGSKNVVIEPVRNLSQTVRRKVERTTSRLTRWRQPSLLLRSRYTAWLWIV